MRRVWLEKTSWICTAAASFLDAATTVVGTPRPTSSAWDGPVITPTAFSGYSDWMIWLMVRNVSSSNPLLAFTRMVSLVRNGFTRCATERINRDGTTNTTMSLFSMQCGSVVNPIPFGIFTPGSLVLCSPSRRIAWTISSEMSQTATWC